MTSPPTVVGDVVVVSTQGGQLVTLALDGCGAALCAPIASYAVGTVAGPAIYANGRIIVGTTDGQVVAYGLPAT